MDWIELITKLIIPICCCVATWVVIPLIRDERKRKAASDAVRAAETLFPAGSGDDKYAYVRSYLIEKCNVKEDEAKVLIEAAVGILHSTQAIIEAQKPVDPEPVKVEAEAGEE